MSSPTRRRGWMLVAGVIVVVGGLIAAGALWFAAGQRLDDNIAGFARAPSGCVTTLDFDRTGAFRLHVETTGRLDGLAGNCSAASDYARDDVPEPRLELVDPNGDVVEIESVDGSSYDAGGFNGEQIGLIEISATGGHTLTVESDGAQFAIAVGGDADEGVALLRWSAFVAAIAATVVGGLLLVAGSRRPSATSPTAEPWEPADGQKATWPAGPPGFPPPPPTTGAAGPAGPPTVPDADRPLWGPPPQSPTQ